MTTIESVQDTTVQGTTAQAEAQLVLAVEQALAAASATAPVQVEVAEGVVILTGEVHDVAAAKAATAAVLRAPGVIAVADEVRIHGFEVRPRHASPRDAARRVRAVLHGWHSDHGAVAVEVNGTVATLTGWACSDAERQEAVRATWATGHVSEVQCRIRIPA